MIKTEDSIISAFAVRLAFVGDPIQWFRCGEYEHRVANCPLELAHRSKAPHFHINKTVFQLVTKGMARKRRQQGDPFT